MLIAYNRNRDKICAKCGGPLSDGSVVVPLLPRGLHLNLNACEKTVLLCGNCGRDDEDHISDFPYLARSRRKKLKHAYEVIRAQAEKMKADQVLLSRLNTVIEEIEDATGRKDEPYQGPSKKRRYWFSTIKKGCSEEK